MSRLSSPAPRSVLASILRARLPSAVDPFPSVLVWRRIDYPTARRATPRSKDRSPPLPLSRAVETASFRGFCREGRESQDWIGNRVRSRQG